MAQGDLLGSRGQSADGEGRAGRKRVSGQLLQGGPKVTSDLHERIAVLETKVDRLVEDLSSFATKSTDARHTQTDTFNRRTNELEEKLDTILNAFEQAKGAKWMFLATASVIASVGGWIAAKMDIINQFFHTPR